ncbi:MAG: hypothetical protein ACREN8_03280 [Candidatus Dormibacteraceae bacterium]
MLPDERIQRIEGVLVVITGICLLVGLFLVGKALIEELPQLHLELGALPIMVLIGSALWRVHGSKGSK